MVKTANCMSSCFTAIEKKAVSPESGRNMTGFCCAQGHLGHGCRSLQPGSLMWESNEMAGVECLWWEMPRDSFPSL